MGTEDMNTEAEEAFLRDWAARQKVIYDDEGECGFGRECVGITTGDKWIDLGPSVHINNEYGGYDEMSVHPDAYPPQGVVDAYHKHDCLAVLGRGPYAIHQLFLWVSNLKDKGFVIARSKREPSSPLDALFHGFEYVYLEKR